MKTKLLAPLLALVLAPLLSAQTGSRPVITKQPEVVTSIEGGVAELSVQATGTAPMQYQWRVNRSPIARETNPTLRILDARLSDNGLYDVVVTNEAGSVTSNPALVTVQSSRMINLSTRAAVGSGSQALAVGLVVNGRGRRVLIRAVGPGLAPFGITDFLPNPVLRVYRAEAAGPRQIAMNDDWDSRDPVLVGAAAAVGAFALTPNSQDAALILNLAAGNYTIEVTASDAQKPGIALVEAYELGEPF